MALETYTDAQVYIDGALLSEEASVSVRRTMGSQRVFTVAKGFAGVSPGAPVMEISVTNAVPSADFEVNPGKFMKTYTPPEITIFASGKALTFKAFIEEDNFSHAVNQESKLEFKAVAPFADWS